MKIKRKHNMKYKKWIKENNTYKTNEDKRYKINKQTAGMKNNEQEC